MSLCCCENLKIRASKQSTKDSEKFIKTAYIANWFCNKIGLSLRLMSMFFAKHCVSALQASA